MHLTLNRNITLEDVYNHIQHNIMERSFYDKRTMLDYCLLALLLQVPQYATHGLKPRSSATTAIDAWIASSHEIGELNARAPARARASGEAAPFPAKGLVEQ